MKKLINLFWIFLAFQLVAQNGVLTNAILLQREGDLVKALSEINKASEHDKTKGLAKTWYYKGVIYRDIFVSEDSPAKTQVQDALMESTDFFKKAIALDDPKGEYRKLSQDMLNQNYVDIINRGYSQYQTGKLQVAMEMYRKAQELKPMDTTAYVYGFAAAMAGGDKVEQKRILDSLLKIVPNHAFALQRVSEYYLIEEDYSKLLSTSQTALTYYPTDKGFQRAQFQAWQGLKKTDESQAWLTDKLKATPFDVDYLLWQALLFKQLKNPDQELLYYQKLMALEPYHFIANYNSALIYVDRGNALVKKNDASYKAAFNKALEYAKKAKSFAIDEELPTVEELIKNLESIK